jgi:hypothetical protein
MVVPKSAGRLVLLAVPATVAGGPSGSYVCPPNEGGPVLPPSDGCQVGLRFPGLAPSPVSVLRLRS